MLVVHVLLIGIVAALAAAGGWWLWSARGRPEDQTRQVWRIAPAPHDFFHAPEPVTVGVSRLVAGMGAPGSEGSGDDADATHPNTVSYAPSSSIGDVSMSANAVTISPLLVYQQDLGGELPALLTGNVGATFASIPVAFSGRVPFAAAGSGVVAWPVDGAASSTATGSENGAQPLTRGSNSSGSDAQQEFTDPGPTFQALPAPGWLLGLSSAGNPVQVQLVPGSTVLLHGAGSAERLLERLPADLPWVRVLRAEFLDAPSGKAKATNTHLSAGTVHSAKGAQGQSATDTQGLGERWREAWSPTICRVVLASSTEEATRHGIIADLLIDSRGTVSHRGHDVRFDPMHLPSTNALEHAEASH
ncbi:hypothetical protein [Corynebacterium urealyticum]|uniref:hypothetical protein n=1 Tax=Corynebacterium urealyticum TaxID=43771 RepID=UPI0011E63F76|nr:hypothetical protein [Corynebacterium urealyticum]TYR15427.1 hypothetical protein FYJ89_02505 [Corynebacterium urealyticum]